MDGKRTARDDLHSGTSSSSPTTDGNVSMSRLGRMLAWVKRQDEAIASQTLSSAPQPELLAPPPPPKKGRKRAAPAADGAPSKKRKAAGTKARASATPQAGAKPRGSTLSKEDHRRLQAAIKKATRRRDDDDSDGVCASELDKDRPIPRKMEEAVEEARLWREQTRNALIAKANEEWPFPDDYHLYRDESGRVAAAAAVGAPAPFIAVMLVKPIMERNQVKRVNLRLYESDAEPRRYAAFVRHVGEMSDREGKTLAPEGSEWEVAWKAFADEFHALTGVEWSEREKAVPGSGRQLKEQEYYFGNFLITI
jgi:hypothetical protein